MPLFDDIARTDARHGKRSESQFRFLNRVAGREFDAVRSLMEEWFERFPDESKNDLRQRFRSDDPRSSLGAFWELYVHEIHRRLGYDLQRDPEVPGTSKRPDFLASRGESAFYLEATIVSYSDDEMAARTRWNVVLDLVDEAFNPDFYLGLNITLPGRETPAKRDIVPPIEEWLASLDWAEAQAADTPAEWVLSARDWALELRAYPKADSSRGDPLFLTVGFNRPVAYRADERGRIEKDLKDKALRYGEPDLPFVVAALCVRNLATEQSIEWALYGPLAVTVPIRDGVGQMDDAFLQRDPSGLWQRGGDPQVTRLSAVLTARHINPWLVASADLTLWQNPWATKPLHDEFPWRTVIGDLAQNRLVTTEPQGAARDVLRLNANWPYSPSA